MRSMDFAADIIVIAAVIAAVGFFAGAGLWTLPGAEIFGIGY